MSIVHHASKERIVLESVNVSVNGKDLRANKVRIVHVLKMLTMND